MQTATLSWTSSESLRHRRRREAKLRLRKHHSHHHTTLFDPYGDEDEGEEDDEEREEDLEFGSSSSEASEDSQIMVASPVSSPVSSPRKQEKQQQQEKKGKVRPLLLQHDEMINMVYSLDTTNLRDLETIEKEVAKAAARPVKAIDHHVVEMRVLRGDEQGGHRDRFREGERDRDRDTCSEGDRNMHRDRDIVRAEEGGEGGGDRHACSSSHSYTPHGGSEEAFVPIATVSSKHSHLDINISKYPNSCLQFRIRAATEQGIPGEHSVVLSFFTPRVASHECRYREEKGPFGSSTGLFYLLGTGFGKHPVRVISSHVMFFTLLCCLTVLLPVLCCAML